MLKLEVQKNRKILIYSEIIVFLRYLYVILFH